MRSEHEQYLSRRHKYARAQARAGINNGYGKASPTSPYRDVIREKAEHPDSQKPSVVGYERTPTGARRIKVAPTRPSFGATVVDPRTGMSVPAGVAKAEDDPGAGLTRGERRARVAGAAALPIPLAGDAVMATAAARMSPEPYRRRTAGQMYGASQTGNYVGGAAGALGAAALANSNEPSRRAMQRVDSGLGRAKDAAFTRTPKGFQSRVNNFKARPKGRVGTAASGVKSAIGSTAPGRLAGSQPAAAAVGYLGGSAAGGQIGQQSMYNRVMNRDDEYRNRQAVGKAMYALRQRSGDVTKREMSARERHELAADKRRTAVLSTIGGVAGVGALAASGTTAGIKNAGKLRNIARSVKAGEGMPPRPERPPRNATEILNSTKTPLLGVSAGVGGINSLGLANVYRQEAENLDPEYNRARRQRYAEAKVHKAGLPKPTAGPKKPRSAARTGHVRRVRQPSGVTSTQSVRGSLR